MFRFVCKYVYCCFSLDKFVHDFLKIHAFQSPALPPPCSCFGHKRVVVGLALGSRGWGCPVALAGSPCGQQVARRWHVASPAASQDLQSVAVSGADPRGPAGWSWVPQEELDAAPEPSLPCPDSCRRQRLGAPLPARRLPRGCCGGLGQRVLVPGAAAAPPCEAVGSGGCRQRVTWGCDVASVSSRELLQSCAARCC